ncbi:MAG: hypothetical protein ACLPVW_05285 [Terriglobales bacterium]
MNTNHVKQLFVQFAKTLPAPGMGGGSIDGEASGRPQLLKGPLLVRGNLVLREELAVQYLEVLDKIDAIVTRDGTWSRASIDHLLAESVFHVANAPAEDRAEITRTQAERIVAQLKTNPGRWHVDIAVAGMSLDCAGQKFGNLQFLRDTVKNRAAHPDENSDEGKVTSVFARACVEAIDRESALHAAIPIADQHLAVLNALFSDWQPSRIHLYRGQPEPFIRESIIRAVKVGDDNPRTEFGRKITGTVLSRAEWDGFLKMRGGAAVSDLLRQNHTFADRVITGYVTAGTACVEPKPQLAFLLFAIALESVVLGEQVKTEITYQLSTRVAHLLALTVAAKRSIVKQVNELYKLRSEIVHSGKNEISETDLYTIREICLRSLFTLTTSPEFTGMKCVEELDQWFDDRMLGGS